MDEDGWATVAEAALVANRKPRTVYEWVQRGMLATRTNRQGATLVLVKAVVRIALGQKRGRPPGIPTRR